MQRLSQVVLLAGGRGSRLGERTKTIPKPLLPVAGKAFLHHLVDEYRRFGFERFLILAGHLGDQIRDYFETTRLSKGSVDVVIEPEALGTGGALRFAASRLDESFLLANSDSLFAINFLDFVRPPSDSTWIGKIALRRIDDNRRYGVVETSGEKVIAFRERGEGGTGLINGGIYLLRREILNYLSEGASSLERDVFPQLAQSGFLFNQIFTGSFLDIGLPETLAAAEHLVPAILTRPAAFLDRDGVFNSDDCYIHRPEEFHWVVGAKAAIKELNDANYLVIVVTNQAGVARGYFSEDVVRDLHLWINDELRKVGAHVDAFYYCPHHPEGDVEIYRRVCGCRKPGPGMLEQAMTDWPIRKDGSFIIGDKESDLEAGRAVGLPGHLFAGGDLHEFVHRAIQSAG